MRSKFKKLHSKFKKPYCLITKNAAQHILHKPHNSDWRVIYSRVGSWRQPYRWIKTITYSSRCPIRNNKRDPGWTYLFLTEKEFFAEIL